MLNRTKTKKTKTTQQILGTLLTPPPTLAPLARDITFPSNVLMTAIIHKPRSLPRSWHPNILPVLPLTSHWTPQMTKPLSLTILMRTRNLGLAPVAVNFIQPFIAHMCFLFVCSLFRRHPPRSVGSSSLFSPQFFARSLLADFLTRSSSSSSS